MRCLVLVLLLLVTPAYGEEAKLYPVTDSSWPVKGPAQAKGVVLWSHGTTTWYTKVGEAAQTSVPLAMAVFLAKGWDLYRLDRPALQENYRTSTRMVEGAVEELRGKGYRQVVLAGQSFGGWISVIAAGEVQVEGVIALAPAAYGMDAQWVGNNRTFLRDYLGEVRAGTRVVVAFFEGDPFDPGKRGEMAEAVLGEHHLAHLVIDHPPGIKGHGGGYSVEFTKRYAVCLVSFVETGACQ